MIKKVENMFTHANTMHKHEHMDRSDTHHTLACLHCAAKSRGLKAENLILSSNFKA